MSNISKIFTWAHLIGNPESPLYGSGLLYISLVLVLLPVIIFIYLRFRGRPESYRKFDQLWTWGFFSIGLLGLFEWFSVDQALPTFGTRLAVYLWTLFLIGLSVYVIFYFYTKTVKEIAAFHEKKRKEKYLK